MKKHFYLASFNVKYTTHSKDDDPQALTPAFTETLTTQLALDTNKITAKDLVNISYQLVNQFVEAAPETNREVLDFNLLGLSYLGEMEPEEFTANLPNAE